MGITPVASHVDGSGAEIAFSPAPGNLLPMAAWRASFAHTSFVYTYLIYSGSLKLLFLSVRYGRLEQLPEDLPNPSPSFLSRFARIFPQTLTIDPTPLNCP